MATASRSPNPRNHAEITKFFIFNVSRGQIEGHERDKIIYHWAKNAPDCKADLKTQIQDVCLCDASINFCKQFDSHGSQQMMLFENSKLVTIQVEKDHWFAASISRLPSRDSAASGNTPAISGCGSVSGYQTPSNSGVFASSARLHLPPQQMLTQSAESKRFNGNRAVPPSDGGLPRSASATSLHNQQNSDNISDCTSPLVGISPSKRLDPDQLMSDQVTIPSDDIVVSCGIIELLLTNLYRRFCLLNGTFQMLMDSLGFTSQDESHSDESLDRLRSICSNYFDQIMASTKLYSIITNINLLYSHIQYLNLDCMTLMKVNSFVNQILCLNSSLLTSSLVMFNNQLIWSSLTLYDTRILYHYLVSSVIREAVGEELSGEINKVRRIKSEQKIYLSNSLTDSHGPNAPALVPADLKPYYITIFRSSNDMTLCLIHRRPDDKLMDKCEKLLCGDPRIGMIPLASLAQMVGQTFVKMNSRFGQKMGNSTHSMGSTPIGVVKTLADDTKYAYLDHSSGSYKAPIGLDIRKTIDGESILKNLKFSKYFVEFEEDAKMLETSCDNSFMQELLARTLSDSWLTASRTNSRKLYSLHHNKNASLVEAHHSANYMKKQFNEILF